MTRNAWRSLPHPGLGMLLLATGLAAAEYVPSAIRPPAPAREFRGAWIATVNNIDWPSAPGLSTARQKAELTGLMDVAVQLRLNALLFQVRPACDAMYASQLEPWSEYLSGRMGQAPQPFYDPLKFAIEEAHRRGLELHAWFNPFRARHPSARSAIVFNHVSRIQPHLVRTYGNQLWLDPGEKAAHEHTQRVILDILRRYDVDGIHFDDYFYPYPVRDGAGREVDFPDGSSWAKYRKTGGKLDRADWRRQNVNEFIQRLYREIRNAKPTVKFGISPFGIWRPGVPAQIRGFDAYEKLYADARHWLKQGWLDYLAPQLYWATDDTAQSYPVLLQWWAAQNDQQRHLWPGISCYRHPPAELLNQVRQTRKQDGASGNIHWSMKVLAQNRSGLADRLAREVYSQPALVPASTWLDRTPPGQPRLRLPGGAKPPLRLAWDAVGGDPAWLWLLQTRTPAGWTCDVLPGDRTSHVMTRAQLPEAITLTAVDHSGNVGPAAGLELRKEPSRRP